MPAARPFLDRRRRSSHAIFSPAKAGIYGIPARPVTFAPNVTPVSFTEPDDAEDDANTDPLASLALAASDSSAGPNVKALSAKLFPASAADASSLPPAPPTRKRCPPGKRRSQGYIPRPPNAFMLFRADFVKQRHVPGSVETNHVSLSKIIGECWRQLPLEEKRVWEVKAKQEKAAHKAIYPDYRFRPVHNKHKKKTPTNADEPVKDDVAKKQPSTAEDERRCEEVAQLLLEGKNGDELARAVADLDRARSRELELGLSLSPGLELDDGYEYDLDADSRRPSVDFIGGGYPDGSRSAPSTMTLHVSAPTALHLPFPTGMSEPGFAAQPSFFPSSSSLAMGLNADMRYHRRSSSVPLPNEWFVNPNPFGPSSNSVNGGIALPTVPPFVSRPPSSSAGFNQDQDHRQGGQGGFQQQHQHQQEFIDPNSLHWQSQQSFQPHPYHNQQMRQSVQFASPQFPGQQLGLGFLSAHQPQQQQGHADGQGLFHPHPQQAQAQSPSQFLQASISPRSSLGHRRASSAGPFFRRSWTMSMQMQSFDYSPDMGMDYSNMGMGMGMERDPSPLPDVDPAAAGLFADFSFGNSNNNNATGGGSNEQSHGQSMNAKHAHARSVSASASASVDPTSVVPPAPVSPIDTSIPRLVHSHTQLHSNSQSLSQDSASSEASSSSVGDLHWSGPNDTSGLDMNGYPNHRLNHDHDGTGLYAPDSANPNMISAQAQVYAPDQVPMYGLGMGLGMYDAFSQHGVELGEGYELGVNGKPTEASFGLGLDAHGDGAYFEVA